MGRDDLLEVVRAKRRVVNEARASYNDAVVAALRLACPDLRAVWADWAMDGNYVYPTRLTVRIQHVEISTGMLDREALELGPPPPRAFADARPSDDMFSELGVREATIIRGKVRDWDLFYRAITAWAFPPGGGTQADLDLGEG